MRGVRLDSLGWVGLRVRCLYLGLESRGLGLRLRLREIAWVRVGLGGVRLDSLGWGRVGLDVRCLYLGLESGGVGLGLRLREIDGVRGRVRVGVEIAWVGVGLGWVKS